MCDRLLESGAELGAIVHIAGGSSAFGARNITPQNIVDAVNVNLVSPMIIVHKLIPALAEGSVIINASAMTGFHAGWYPTDACFDAAKGGIHRLRRTWPASSARAPASTRSCWACRARRRTRGCHWR